MNLSLSWLACLLVATVYPVLANVEKAIFLGPVALRFPTQSPTLNNLGLPYLSPTDPILRRQITARFPQDDRDTGEVTWFLLQGLTFEQRYEVRICWAATQPTDFRLDTYELPDVLASSSLTHSLVRSISKNGTSDDAQVALIGIAQALQKPGHDITGLQSVLLLRISAKADYHSSNMTLMQNVPPVLVDVILDPFILNVLPQTLKYTATYLLLLALLSWHISAYIAEWLHIIVDHDDEKKNA